MRMGMMVVGEDRELEDQQRYTGVSRLLGRAQELEEEIHHGLELGDPPYPQKQYPHELSNSYLFASSIPIVVQQSTLYSQGRSLVPHLLYRHES